MKKILFLTCILALVFNCVHIPKSELEAVHYAKDQYDNCYFYYIDKSGAPSRLGISVIDGDIGKCPPGTEGKNFLSVYLERGEGARRWMVGGNFPSPLDCWVHYGTSSEGKAWVLKKCPSLKKRDPRG